MEYGSNAFFPSILKRIAPHFASAQWEQSFWCWDRLVPPQAIGGRELSLYGLPFLHKASDFLEQVISYCFIGCSLLELGNRPIKSFLLELERPLNKQTEPLCNEIRHCFFLLVGSAIYLKSSELTRFSRKLPRLLTWSFFFRQNIQQDLTSPARASRTRVSNTRNRSAILSSPKSGSHLMKMIKWRWVFVHTAGLQLLSRSWTVSMHLYNHWDASLSPVSSWKQASDLQQQMRLSL